MWTSVSIPATGGWQTWSTVNVPITLAAGTQLMTLVFDAPGFNLDSINVVAGQVAPPPPPPPPPGPVSSVRIMTWNVRSGTDLNGNPSLAAQIQFIAAQHPDIVLLEEVSRWNGDDGVKYRDGLQQATGQTWYFYEALGSQCANNAGCIVEEVLSRYPISSGTTMVCYPTAFGRVVVNVGAVAVNVLTTHLEYYDTNLRTTELNAMMAWARSFPGPRIVSGDFNSWWGEWWIGQMRTEYHDTWLDYSGQEDGAYTTGNVRFDYIFRAFDGAWRLTPTNAFVPWTTLSDHRPFIGDFNVQ